MKQLSFIEDMESQSPITLLDCLAQYINIKEVIPIHVYRHYYKNNGRKHKYSLTSYINALLVQKLFSITQDNLLITLLNLSKELRQFCGFNSIPDKTQFSRFKTTYSDDLEDIFHLLVDLTDPICQSLGVRDAETLIIDTTGIPLYVTENNPKYLKGAMTKINTLIKSSNIEITNIDKSILSCMSKRSSANTDASLQYINGHFSYALKGSIICNAHGIVRHMQLDDFTNYSDNPLISKHIHDSTLFKPTLTSLFEHHPNSKAKYIVGDSGFDSAANHNSAFKDFGLIPIISLNRRNTNPDIPSPSFTNNTPCCPLDVSLPLKYCGITKENNRATRFKYICPKAIASSNGYSHTCNTPCSSAACGYIHYEYEPDNLRENPVISRDSQKYNLVAGKRHIVEQVISRLKLPLNMGGSYIRDSRTAKADFFMAGIAHLITVLLAYRMDLPHKVRSSKSIA